MKLLISKVRIPCRSFQPKSSYNSAKVITNWTRAFEASICKEKMYVFADFRKNKSGKNWVCKSQITNRPIAPANLRNLLTDLSPLDNIRLYLKCLQLLWFYKVRVHNHEHWDGDPVLCLTVILIRRWIFYSKRWIDWSNRSFLDLACAQSTHRSYYCAS